jgi:hypothetical protein
MNRSTYTALSTYPEEYQTCFKKYFKFHWNYTVKAIKKFLVRRNGCSPLSNYCECDNKTKKSPLLAKENIFHHSVQVIKQKLLVVRNIFQTLLYKLLGRDFFWVTGSASGRMCDKFCCPAVFKKET